MRPLFVLGRFIFGGFFAYNGINHFLHQKTMSQYAGAKGVPASESAVPATGAMLLAGGASIMAGVRPRQGLARAWGGGVGRVNSQRECSLLAPDDRHRDPINRRRGASSGLCQRRAKLERVTPAEN